MEDPEFKSMMERIEASNAGQEKYAKKQYLMSKITAMASILVLGIVLFAAVSILPKVNDTFQNMDIIMKDLEQITAELAAADLQQMITDVDHLVTSSEQNIQDALTQVNSIDIDTLNQAIKNLSDVISPLANFFNRF
ncbi:MAG: hypothetical protein RSF83_04580 [Hungatella sp.]